MGGGGGVLGRVKDWSVDMDMGGGVVEYVFWTNRAKVKYGIRLDSLCEVLLALESCDAEAGGAAV